MKLILLLLLSLLGCEKKPESGNWQTLHSRENIELYRAKVPADWQKSEPEINLSDTKKPIGEFFLGSIRITIHTFPYNGGQPRIPPIAQIERWKTPLDPLSLIIEPVSQGGFTGLLLEGENKEEKVIAWSMRLSDCYDSKLDAHSPLRADYTIKAIGHKEFLQQSREAILQFAKSFELIEELPSLQ